VEEKDYKGWKGARKGEKRLLGEGRAIYIRVWQGARKRGTIQGYNRGLEEMVWHGARRKRRDYTRESGARREGTIQGMAGTKKERKGTIHMKGGLEVKRRDYIMVWKGARRRGKGL